MQIDGDRLNISLDMTQADIDELKKFVLPRLEYIEEVGFEGGDDEMPLSSALIAFLVSLKKTKSNIKIPFIDGGGFDFKKLGKAEWICHE